LDVETFSFPLGNRDSDLLPTHSMLIRRLPFLVAGLLCAATASAQLTEADVQLILNQAASRAQEVSPNSVIAVVDREGYVLGIWTVRGGEPTPEEIATAVSKAGTAAFLSSDQNAFTSRTAGFIIQQHFPPGVKNTAADPEAKTFPMDRLRDCARLNRALCARAGLFRRALRGDSECLWLQGG
jgi:hypothetical protein